jgi:hypothetical protein
MRGTVMWKMAQPRRRKAAAVMARALAALFDFEDHGIEQAAIEVKT